MIDVCLLGTGGMMPLPNRALTAMMLRYNGSSILVDCGEGTQVSIRQLGWSVKPVDVICFTHFHADHISGLPGFLLTLGNAEKHTPLTIVGPKRLEKVVNALRMIAPELPFPIQFIELNGEEEELSLCGLTVTAFRVQHGVICYGYSFSLERAGRFYVEMARENDVPMKLWSRLQKGETVEEDGRIYTPDMVLGEARKGLKVTYCTDSRPVPSITKNARGSDLFICEGMYGDAELAQKAKDKKHMTFYEAAKIGRDADVKQMWLTHYSPSMVRPEPYMKEVYKIFDRVEPGRDRQEITLKFEEE
ncbi:MAG: ribonuclease Z [Lachnospiraceae bacterium]|nr:ribonuclease Z [Lachnospiraceae bacterium]